MEEKDLQFPRTAEEAATLYVTQDKTNREKLSALHQERSIIYFLPILLSFCYLNT